MTTPAPGTTVDVNIYLGDIDTRFNANVLLDADSDADDQPPIRTVRQGFTLPPYVIVDGRPRQDVRRGARIASRAGLDAFTKVTAPLDPLTLDIGSWARWLPLAADLDPPANGGRRWYPRGWAHSGTNPRMSLYSIIGTGTGRGTYGADSPGIDVGYTYQGANGQMSRPAMVFDGKAAATIDPTTTFASCTVAIAAVFHGNANPYYGIFEANNGGNGEPLVYRYTHGRVDVFQNDVRVLSHETAHPAHFPVILLVSLDAATDTGRMMCIDQRRTSRTFSVEGLDFVSMAGVIGALGQGTLASPWRYGSDMDLLELDLWNRALDFPEMEAAANLLALAYGIVG